MHELTAFRTADGQLHASRGAATRHADKRFGEAVSRHAHALARLEKYTAICAYLDDNAEALAELAALKRDRDIIEGGDND